jgi:DNA-binding response OmpR family regulator
VLIADDDPQLVGLFGVRLRKLGCEVLEAIDGDQALEVARRERPDIVVLDIMMPRRTGWEVARELRQDERTKDTAIVVLTAIGEDLNALTSPLHGADEFLDKPFEFAQLEAAMTRAMARRSRR